MGRERRKDNTSAVSLVLSGRSRWQKKGSGW